MATSCTLLNGSSPRGRGTPPGAGRRAAGARFIPAWAGNAEIDGRIASRQTVHPRVGGERGEKVFRGSHIAGSSPRGRGTQRRHHRQLDADRFIPAWAGNAPPPRASPPATTVHPRVGGERSSRLRQSIPQPGSSPRGRGTRGSGSGNRQGLRFIPAWAGNAHRQRQSPPPSAVHPRVGGERDFLPAAGSLTDGSSPRGRGTQGRRREHHHRRRFIPAWAGNAWRTSSRLSPKPVHPRVGGERGPRSGSQVSALGSSPRGRGTQAGKAFAEMSKRFIPAWAGNARRRRRWRWGGSVHPRVGGERDADDAQPVGCAGSSPRGRGTRLSDALAECNDRFIPAWAGNARQAPPG